MVLLAAGALALLCWLGTTLYPSPVPVAVAAGGGASPHALGRILLAMAVIILAARVVGAMAARLRQPPVVGEIAAGLMLGPSLLGHVAPGASAYLFEGGVAGSLELLAQLGVILFMFQVGLDLDTGLLARRTRAAVAISHASIILPMLLGACLALAIYPRLAPAGVRFTPFSLFLGVAMSVTAFPVLARILTDRGIRTTRLGVLSISCAAVDDVTAWCLLAVLTGVAQARVADAVATIALTVAYVVLVLAVVRPLAARLARDQEVKGRVGPNAVVLSLVCLLLSALATEAIGIHALFGAFLLGAVVPHGSLLARELSRSLEHMAVLFLLPAFFAYTGLRTRIGLVDGLEGWLLCGLIILVACAGKLGGSALAARLTGLSWRQAACIGALMNTRGLMELIVLNVGLDLGVISPTLFAMMVVMALATTLATAPLLQALLREDTVELPGAPATSTG